RVGTFFAHYLDFIHRIIGRYHFKRLLIMYPFYLTLAFFMAVGTIWRHSRRYRNPLLRSLGVPLQLLVEAPSLPAAAWGAVLTPTGALGRVAAARLWPAPSAIGDDDRHVASP